MATAATSPTSSPSQFDLGNRTPNNLNVAARNALLRNGVGTAESEILAIRNHTRRPALTSSPLNPAAATTEGAQRASHDNPLDLHHQPPVSIAASAHRLAQETAKIHETKIAVFKAFCSAFDETAKQFTSGPAFRFAQEFSQSFIHSWENTLNGTPVTTARPSYAAAASNGIQAATGPPFNPFPVARGHKQPQPQFPTFNHQLSTPVSPPKDDLRVFVRLEDDSASRTYESYAVRTHIASKLGIELGKVPQASRTKTGWAVRATDIATRNLVIERQSEWVGDLGATKAEASQRWYTYVVDDCPRRLFDLQGGAVDQDAATLEEVTSQTGFNPVSIRPTRNDSNHLPTKTLLVSFLEPVPRRWRLFGSSKLARFLHKSPLPTQCENCWDFHSKYGCNRASHCKRCGKTGHSHETCSAPEQCANCLAPHAADFPICPARPKRVHGEVQRLNWAQRGAVRQAGARLFRQYNMETAVPAEVPSSSPAPMASSPCIQVAHTPLTGDTTQSESSVSDSSPINSPPVSPKKRRLESHSRNV